MPFALLFLDLLRVRSVRDFYSSKNIFLGQIEMKALSACKNGLSTPRGPQNGNIKATYGHILADAKEMSAFLALRPSLFAS
jgi:hypothetical protein